MCIETIGTNSCYKNVLLDFYLPRQYVSFLKITHLKYHITRKIRNTSSKTNFRKTVPLFQKVVPNSFYTSKLYPTRLQKSTIFYKRYHGTTFFSNLIYKTRFLSILHLEIQTEIITGNNWLIYNK